MSDWSKSENEDAGVFAAIVVVLTIVAIASVLLR